MADDEQFSLCWNNFNSNLSAGFHESLCRGDLVDVTLAAEGQFVKAHRLVLSVCSPYFRKMFTQMPPNQHAFVFLKDVSHSALKDLIQFMYCGEVNVKQDALPAFISTAEALQIKGLTDSDPAPSQSPAKPSTPAPQPAPPAQTLASPRVRQRSSTSRSYRIETDDSDDKTTQIVLQATAAVQQQTQPTIVQQTNTTAAVVTQKRTAPRSISTPHTKRVKNSADPLEASEPTQIAVQTITESKSSSEPEFIELPIEIPTKSEPDYTEEAGEVETAEQETTYVEDDSYGDMKYDESYFTENDESGAAAGGAGAATTSTAVVKQSFVDNSYVEQADQSASEAQEKSKLTGYQSEHGDPLRYRFEESELKHRSVIRKIVFLSKGDITQPCTKVTTDQSTVMRLSGANQANEIIRMDSGPCTFTANILRAIYELRSLITHIIEETRNLREEIADLKNKVMDESSATSWPFKNLPCTTVEDFNSYEAKIRDDNLARKALEHSLRNMSDQSLKKYIRCCLRLIVNDEVAANYSWQGKKQNIAVKDFTILTVIGECTRDKFPSTSSIEIIEILKKWFHYAKDRLRRQRHEERLEERDEDNIEGDYDETPAENIG